MTDHKPAQHQGNARKGGTPRAGTAKPSTTTADKARDLAQKAAAGIEENPLAALVGGLAVGALAGTFVPRSAQEAKLLAPVGQKLAATTRGAVDSARESAKAQFGVFGLADDSGTNATGKLVGDVLKALATAGTAALSSKGGPSVPKPAAPSDRPPVEEPDFAD